MSERDWDTVGRLPSRDSLGYDRDTEWERGREGSLRDFDADRSERHRDLEGGRGGRGQIRDFEGGRGE